MSSPFPWRPEARQRVARHRRSVGNGQPIRRRGARAFPVFSGRRISVDIRLLQRRKFVDRAKNSVDQHERAQAWPLYRGSHRAAASALRADQDGAGYPRRAQRTALEAPKRTAFKPRSAPSSGRALLAVARLLITRRQCSPFSPNPGAAWSRSNLGRAAGALDRPGGAQDADPGVVRARAEPEVRIHLPPAQSPLRTCPTRLRRGGFRVAGTITPGKQRAGLSSRRALIGILGSRASP